MKKPNKTGEKPNSTQISEKKRPQTTRNLAYQFNLINDESMTEKNETTTDNKPDNLETSKSKTSLTNSYLDWIENLSSTWHLLETTSSQVNRLKKSKINK